MAAPRKPMVKPKVFADLVEEALEDLTGVLDAPYQYWREAQPQWRSRVKIALDRAAELKPWIEAERQRHGV